jgi:hypothetical protein
MNLSSVPVISRICTLRRNLTNPARKVKPTMAWSCFVGFSCSIGSNEYNINFLHWFANTLDVLFLSFKVFFPTRNCKWSSRAELSIEDSSKR